MLGLGARCAARTPWRGTPLESDPGGQAQIPVGTHALIQKGVGLADLAVAVVDEQNFGSAALARSQSGRTPHLLHMTATPIPRTLALTVYGDL